MTSLGVFRDPPSADDEARGHRLELARALVGAEALPIELPRFGLTLLDVEPIERAVELVLGASGSALARARITRREDQLGFEVVMRETQPGAVRHRATLAVLRERLTRAMTAERWARAESSAKAIARLPVGVPLSHMRQLIEGIEPPSGLVRTGFRCNQDCGFCWQSRSWAGYDAAQVQRWIEDLAAMGVTELTISGGEPTLDRALVEHVALAKRLGMRG